MVVYSPSSSLQASVSAAYTKLTTDPASLLPSSGTALVSLGSLLGLALVAALIARLAGTSLRTVLVFAYNCFLQPLGKTNNQGERLDRFYQNQATGVSSS